MSSGWIGSSMSNPGVHGPPEVDRIWRWVCYSKIPIYPNFIYLRGTIPLKLQIPLTPCRSPSSVLVEILRET